MDAADEARPDERSAVADAIGGAAAYSARVAARVWRGPLEAAAEELLSTPEARRALDRTLSSPLPEELGRLLVRHRVVERVVHELVASGELERMLETTLASPESQALVDRLLASPAMGQALERVLSGPEVRAALTSQTAGFAEQVVGGARDTTAGLDRRLSLGGRRSPASPFAGVASRGVALAIDASAVVVATAVAGGAAGLVGAVVGGVRPDWLAQALLSLATLAIAFAYFGLFWHTAGQTPGMRLLGVRVLSKRDDGRLTVWQAILRTIGLALAIIPCFLGFVPALFDRRRRALPDYLAGTVVVYDDGSGHGARS
ncbi:MAG TPA: RDD family protein [Gaiellaceae bacterium]|nr:RDD family protein [Gaiellaceae bacterium]